MKTSILAGMSPDMKDALKKEFGETSQLRKRLVVMLEERALQNYKDLMSTNSFDNANWAYKQAEGVGYSRGISEIIALLSE